MAPTPQAWTHAELQALQEGDERTWKAFVHHFAPKLYRYFLSALADEQEADDLVGETLAAALGQLNQFRRESNIETWLFKIGRHKLYDRYSALRRFRDFVSRYTPLQRMVIHPEEPDGALLRKMAFASLVQAMASLPLRNKEALHLRFVEELSIKETAAILGITTHQVKNATRDGKHLLRRKLEAYEKRLHLREKTPPRSAP